MDDAGPMSRHMEVQDVAHLELATGLLIGDEQNRSQEDLDAVIA
jgi:hypothetical protein